MTLKSIVTLLLITAVCFSPIAAQTPAPVETSKEEEQKAQKELEKKALGLLNEVLDGTQMLKLSENRSYLSAIAADLLWKHDEKRARAAFQIALTELAQALKEIGSLDQRRESVWILAGQRQQILTTVARRDPQFALDLLQSTRQAFSENQPMWASMMDQELMIEQTIIAEVASNDPKRALQMAQESLAKGVTYQTITLIRRIQAKDSEGASSFTGDVVKKLRSMDLTKSHDASYVAQELLRMLIQPERYAPSATATPAAKKIGPLVVDDQVIRDLTDIVVTTAVNASSERADIMMLQSLIPELEKRSPERAAQLKRKLAETNDKIDPMYKQMMQYQVLIRDGKADAIVEAAAKAPTEMRGFLYQSAVSKLMQAGDLEGARKVIMDNMTSPDRDQMLANIDTQLISRALAQDKLDEARKLIERITPKEARLAQLANMAKSMFAKGDSKTALLLLAETQELVNRPPENQQELNAMLNVARAYAMIEPARAFSIIEPVIDQANAIVAAAAVLEKFGADRGFFKSGEFRIQVNMISKTGFSSTYAKEISVLARTDFARTRALADRFLRDDTRIMARLAVARAVLSDPPETDANALGAGGVFFGDGN